MEAKIGLHPGDYAVFGVTLVISLCIGIFHSMTGGRQKTTDEYLMGNRKMKVLPVTLSFTVSYISTILILGFPAEIYSFGGQIVVTLIGVWLGTVFACIVFVPLLYPLRLTSVNEVREMKVYLYFLYLYFCILWARERLYPTPSNFDCIRPGQFSGLKIYHKPIYHIPYLFYKVLSTILKNTHITIHLIIHHTQ